MKSFPTTAFASSVLLVLAAVACTAEPRTAAHDANALDPAPEGAFEAYSTANRVDAVCPTGTLFDEYSGFCVDASNNAIGPFSDGMIEACKALGGGATCSTNQWPDGLARDARNYGSAGDNGSDCPYGTFVDRARGMCSDGTSVYGPFDSTIIAECQAAGGAASCLTMRFPLRYSLILPVDKAPGLGGIEGKEATAGLTLAAIPKALAASCGDGAKIFNNYKNAADYSRITRKARADAPSAKGRSAVFASEAMRAYVDPTFPIRESTDGINADGTRAGSGFRDALAERVWTMVSVAACQAGDFAFSQDIDEAGKTKADPKLTSVEDAARGDAHAGCVFFVTDNAGAGALSAIDNQSSGYTRVPGKSGRTPAAYCLRSPSAKQGCAADPADKNAFFCNGKDDGYYCDPDVPTQALECYLHSRRYALQCPTKDAAGKPLYCQSKGGKAVRSSENMLACGTNKGGAPWSVKITGYSNTSGKAIEGGAHGSCGPYGKDGKGVKLTSMADYKAGRGGGCVSIAADLGATAPDGTPLQCGTRLTIDEFPGVPFCVQDTGCKFANTQSKTKYPSVADYCADENGNTRHPGIGRGRMDVCWGNDASLTDPAVNRKVSVRVVK